MPLMPIRHKWHKQANVLAALPKSAHPGALAAMREIYNAEDIDKAQLAIKAFEIDYGAKYPKAVGTIVDDADVLLDFYDSEHVPCLYARGMRCDPVSHRRRADMEATSMVYSSRSGRASRGAARLR